MNKEMSNMSEIIKKEIKLAKQDIVNIKSALLYFNKHPRKKQQENKRIRTIINFYGRFIEKINKIQKKTK